MCAVVVVVVVDNETLSFVDLFILLSSVGPNFTRTPSIAVGLSVFGSNLLAAETTGEGM